MTYEKARRRIEAELAMAHGAAATGNAGMVRVCARRAAGIAIGCWLEESHRTGWAADAVSRLRCVEADASFPDPVRQAAHRLTAKVKGDFTPRFENDPLDDSRTIIGHFLAEGIRQP